jgi:DNA polymerase III epsilon subunit-like protein
MCPSLEQPTDQPIPEGKYNPALTCMQHLNGNLLCAIDCETTGLDPMVHELVQICILPLNSNLEPIRSVLPFYVEIKPEHPDRVSKEAMSVNMIDLATICQRGHDRFKAIELLENWMAKIGLPYTKFGTRKKITPLGHNYQFDKGFIQAWLGHEQYDELFHYHYRDSMIAANFINDRASFLTPGEPVPFSKVNLSWLAKQLNVQTDRAHDSLQDCLTTAGVYRKLLFALQGGLLA